MINDLGKEKLFVESGLTDLFYYYPGSFSETFDTVTLVCVDESVFSFLDVWETNTEIQPTYIDISGETFSVNGNNWLVDMPSSISLTAFRNHEGSSQFKVRKDYVMTMKYCKISDVMLPNEVIIYYMDTLPE